jgi:hypothetical protein
VRHSDRVPIDTPSRWSGERQAPPSWSALVKQAIPDQIQWDGTVLPSFEEFFAAAYGRLVGLLFAFLHSRAEVEDVI